MALFSQRTKTTLGVASPEMWMRRLRYHAGQDLIEGLLILPVLILLVFVSFWVGGAFVAAGSQGANAKTVSQQTMANGSTAGAGNATGPNASVFNAALEKGVPAGSNLQDNSVVFGPVQGQRTFPLPFGLDTMTLTGTHIVNTQLLEANGGNSFGANLNAAPGRALPDPTAFNILDDPVNMVLQSVSTYGNTSNPCGTGPSFCPSDVDNLVGNTATYSIATPTLVCAAPADIPANLVSGTTCQIKMGAYDGAFGVPNGCVGPLIATETQNWAMAGDQTTTAAVATACEGNFTTWETTSCTQQCTLDVSDAMCDDGLGGTTPCPFTSEFNGPTCKTVCATKQMRFCKAGVIQRYMEQIRDNVMVPAGACSALGGSGGVSFTVRKPD